MTLEEQIAALPEWPKRTAFGSIGRLDHALARLEYAEARLALTRRALQAMADSCLCRSMVGRDCDPCANARRVLEVTAP